MSSTIWKFPLNLTDEQWLSVPAGARPLAVQMQGGAITLWALVQPAARPVSQAVAIRGTGHAFNADGWRHIGTVQTPPYVWHVFWGEGQ